MKIALDLALKAKGQTSPNPLVGAVIVKGNRIVAKGYHRRCGSDHAEAVVLRKSGAAARGAKLYVTLEPCSHFGRTPPCIDRIIERGISKVFIGMKDPNPINKGKSIRELRRLGIKTKVGLLQKEVQQINEPFIKFMKYRMPFVVAKCAQTIDGKIATSAGQSKWITSQKTRRYTHNLRNDFDAIVVGINTVLKDNPFLKATRQSKRLKKVIIDTSLRIPMNARLFKKTNPSDIIIATTKKAKQAKMNYFTRKGVHVLLAPQREDRVSLKWVFKELARKELIHILIEGGAEIIGSALREKLVDKMLILIAPKVMGDQKALSSIRGLYPLGMNQVIQLKKMTIKQISDDILVQGYVCRNR